MKKIKMSVSMIDILEFLDDAQRPLKEGLNLFKSNHVRKVGKLCGNASSISEYDAEVVSTSDPKGKPHQLKLRIKAGDVSNWFTKCSCKAGLGRKCKHIFAVLIYLHHKTDLEELSCTDVQQSWGATVAEKTVTSFDAKKAKDMCCFKIVERTSQIPEHVQESNFRRLLDAAPESSASLHFYRRRNLTIPDISSLNVNDQVNIQLRDRLLQILNSNPKHFQPRILHYLEPNIKAFYLKNVLVCLDQVCEINQKTLGQNNVEWKLERRKRIHCSNAYHLYTYTNNKSPDWNKKAYSYINPSDVKTEAMKYGTATEPLALTCYKNTTNNVVLELGFVVSPVLPWFGCSPDGYVENEMKIVEFKCPTLGEKHSLSEMLSKLTYLDSNLRLKTKHVYYAQCQLGMGVLNAVSCDFVVFNKLENKCHIVTIPVDVNYIRDMTRVLTHVYFTYILPALYYETSGKAKQGSSKC